MWHRGGAVDGGAHAGFFTKFAGASDDAAPQLLHGDDPPPGLPAHCHVRAHVLKAELAAWILEKILYYLEGIKTYLEKKCFPILKS